MPAGMRGERILRGSTLVYHSGAAHDAGHAEGVHSPRAPGRTFCPQRVSGLAADGPLSLAPWDGHTLSDQRAIRLGLMVAGFSAGVKSHILTDDFSRHNSKYRQSILH